VDINTVPEFVTTHWTQSLSTCIASTGTDTFPERFINMISQVVPIEQCMIFTYHCDDKMSCVLAKNKLSPEIAQGLADDYITNQFRKDPNIAQIRDALDAGSTTINTLRSKDPEMQGDYREHFFNAPHLVDKISMTCVSEQSCYYINLYRGEQNGKFTAQEVSTLQTIAPIISSLVLKNYATDTPAKHNISSAVSSLLKNLSTRERQICELILKGYTLKVIAAELGISETSAATYRKRAYQKLGIPSKGKLVALCNSETYQA
jgi:DNA-binding NarL/FixJ family response regulator